MSGQSPSSSSSSSSSSCKNSNELKYLAGFGNHFESSAHPRALPSGRNNPRLVPRGLYTEQLSGTAFTAPRRENRRTWLYRRLPSASGTSNAFRACGGGAIVGAAASESELEPESKPSSWAELLPEHFGRADFSGSSRDLKLDPNPMRWGATPLKQDDDDDTAAAPTTTTTTPGNGGGVNFVQGIRTLVGSGDPTCKSGIGIYVYACNANMSKGDDGLKCYHDDDDDEDVENAKLNEDDGGESGDGGESTKSKTKQPGLKGDLHMFNSDGDFLIVPQQMTLRIQTELGIMTVAPGEICVIPRGVVFTVNLVRNSIDANKEQAGEDESSNDNNNNDNNNNFARGYVLEIFRGHFQLPELGPIGSNGLANARDFLHPTAHYESDDDASAIDNNRSTTTCTIVNKFGQNLFVRTSPRTPYNVVAWHGNYLPFKYDLRRFCAVNSVTYDHPDPSIYTVLTAKGGDEDGTALADFVIFPPRILATDENTFRPPWFHRNVMTEFMGLINGEYDAKKKSAGKSGGFVPGGASLHSIMTPHGPDAGSYYANVKNPCDKPTKLDGGLAFMFESSAMCKVSRYALECEQREVDYASCWDGFRDTFPESHV